MVAIKTLFIAAVSSNALLFAATPSEVAQTVQHVASGEILASMVLNGYSQFPRNIGTAPVYDLNGHEVGRIQKLDTDPTGKPSALEIWLRPGRTITVEASNIGYDEQQNVVTAGLTDAQLGISSSAPSPQAR